MNAVQHILIFSVRLYRWTLSPAKTFILGPTGRCRFDPSCSEYALEAVGTHGAVAGTWLALKRVCRCHPWGGCGHDPVPERSKSELRTPKSETTSKSHKLLHDGKLRAGGGIGGFGYRIPRLADTPSTAQH